MGNRKLKALAATTFGFLVAATLLTNPENVQAPGITPTVPPPGTPALEEGGTNRTPTPTPAETSLVDL